MILAIVIILIVGLIGYFHWMQGLLSGFISAVLAVASVCVAFSFYEPMAESISGGKFDDQAQGICLIALFALTYIVLRVIFDKVVPGNIRVPSIADKIGGAVFGAFAGVMATGVFLVAAQHMPFGPSIAGYARFDISESNPVTLPPPAGQYRNIDRTVHNELKGNDLEKGKSGLLLPVDDLVVSLVSHQSGKGALSAGKPYDSVHPDLMQELFGQRIGIEVGGRRTASNKKATQVSVEGVYILPPKLPKAKVVDPEGKTVGGYQFEQVRKTEAGLVDVGGDEDLVAVTVIFHKDASDSSGPFARVSPASIRLVTRDESGDGWKNNYPIGFVHSNAAWMTKPDDFMFFDVGTTDRGAHFLFKLKQGFYSDLKTRAIKPEVFVEVKRLVKTELDGLPIKIGMPPTYGEGEKHQRYLPEQRPRIFKPTEAGAPIVRTDTNPTPTPTPTPTPPTPTPTPTPTPIPTPEPTPTPTPTTAAFEGALEKPQVKADAKLPFPVDTGSADADTTVLSDLVTGEVKAKKWEELVVIAKPVADVQKGGYPAVEFAVPAEKRVVQVTLTPKGADTWAWAEANVASYVVFDGTNTIKPSGAIALVTASGGAKLVTMRYNSKAELGKVEKTDGVVTQVTLVYLLPTASKAVEMRLADKQGGLPLEK